MRIGIINIGDELLAGKIINTNQFDLSKILNPLGHDIRFNLVIGDQIPTIVYSLHWATQGSEKNSIQGDASFGGLDILILTGGLGPTQDDLTRSAVAQFLGRNLVEAPSALEWLGGFLGKDADTLTSGQRNQASIPEGTAPLRNPVGTACGFKFAVNEMGIYAFPGVPSELIAMVGMHLIPELPQDRILLEKSLYTFGWSEGSQSQAFVGLGLSEPFRFSSLPNEKGVRLSLSCLVPISSRDERVRELEMLWEKMVQAIPDESIVDIKGASLNEIVLKLLRETHATVSVAESCTGGALGARLTELPGSSEVFKKGFLTYSNQAKTDLLGVDAEILKTYGAVSEETVTAMVKGCLENSGASYACAITGIAGPTGGTPEKPVGTVWIAVAKADGISVAMRFKFRGNRSEVRSRSCYTALNQLRLLILGKFG